MADAMARSADGHTTAPCEGNTRLKAVKNGKRQEREHHDRANYERNHHGQRAPCAGANIVVDIRRAVVVNNRDFSEEDGLGSEVLEAGGAYH